MTLFNRYLGWAQRPGDIMPGHLRARILVLGPIVLVILGAVWLARGF